MPYQSLAQDARRDDMKPWLYLGGLVLLLVGSARADDWPQWMGPDRDDVWKENGILEKFPAGGPKFLWRVKIAGGYAGPAVAAGKVYVPDFVTAGDTRKQSNPNART